MRADLHTGSWHAQVTSLSLRYYEAGKSFESTEPYDEFTAVAQVEFLDGGVAFVHAVLSRDGAWLSVGRWRELARLLRDKHGVTKIQAVRPGGRIEIDLTRKTPVKTEQIDRS